MSSYQHVDLASCSLSQVMKVPRYDTRLDALVFKLQFKNEHQNLEKTLKTVKQAIHEVLSSQKLRRILEVVLKV